jgi:thiamine-phosphate pyrophosphorylase
MSLQDAVFAALTGGVDGVLLRDKDLPVRERLELARTLRRLTRERGVSLIISGSIDLFLAVGADGIHLPEDRFSISVVRSLLGPKPIIGASTHSLSGIKEVFRDGADYVTLSPVYATSSKTSYGPPLGLHALSVACQEAPLPIFALGGITPDRIESVISCGAAGAAMISSILAAPNPQSAARAFVERIAVARKHRQIRGSGGSTG